MGKRSPLEHREAVLHLLRKIREEADITQQHLADLLERPQSFVSKYETGQRSLDLLELREVLSVLDYDLARFVKELDRKLRRLGPAR